LNHKNQLKFNSQDPRLGQRVERIQAELDELKLTLGSASESPAKKWGSIREAVARGLGSVKLFCDEPAEGTEALVGTVLRVQGWALSSRGIAAVDVRLDEQEPLRAAYGGLRRDTGSAFRNIQKAENSGFVCDLDTSNCQPGRHRVVITATDTGGGRTQLTRTIMLRPFVGIRLFCDEPAGSIELGSESKLRIRGWCLSTTPVTGIQFRIDDGPNQDLHYGASRPDVSRAFPEFHSQDACGFLGETGNVPAGEHRLVITALAANGNSAVVSQNFFVRPPAQDEVHLHCDFPVTRGRHSVRGVVEIRGWALAWSGIRDVVVEIAGMPPLRAVRGMPRPDVISAFPGLPETERPGWRFMWDTTAVPNGRYQIRITATAMSGAKAVLTPEVDVDQAADSAYSQWIVQNEPTPEEKEVMADEVLLFERQPLISVAVPVYKTPPALLARCIDSVLAQLYPNWELCLADDGSKDPELTALLETYCKKDPRVRLVTLEENGGISAATNAALKICTGDYIGFLDSDDELADFAVSEVVKSINQEPETDLFYSDEDKIDEEGHRYDWFFKPGWSPELFLSCNYLCHFIVIRRWVFDQVKKLDESYRGGTQDYEFLLRVTERTTRVKRIPKVLYHWRAIEGSTAKTADEKPQAGLNGQRAIEEHLARHCAGTTVEQLASCRYRVRYPIQGLPMVDIIMPTGGKMDLLRRAAEEILEKTRYRKFQITLIDNSTKGHVEQYAGTLVGNGAPVRYIDWRHKRFNFSLMNNVAVRQSDAPYVLFLNDDMSIVNPEWLSAMLEHAQRPEIGAVGAQLWYPNDTIQHAGVVMGIFGNCAHGFRTLPVTSRGRGQYFDFPWLTRNCSAVTAACLLIEASKFWKAGGFDEENLSVAFQDVDLCLNLLEKGYRNVYVPDAILYHYESATKAEVMPNPVEDHFVKRKWKRYIEDDPYYNPNLAVHDERYGLRLR
jgi:GT2 family glycosyltransferase